MTSARQPDGSPDLTEAERLFVEAVAEGASVETGRLEALCAEHMDHAAELRALADRWRGLDRVLDRLGVSGTLDARVRERFGAQTPPDVSLEPEGPPEPLPAEVLERLSERQGSFGRYRLKGEIDRGGMGAILRVWDRDLRRHLAMKLILEERGGTSSDDSARRLARFLEEAQITGQLDHPGIVPVHELGLDAEGRVYFTMKLVKGRTLREIIDLVHARAEGWSVARALDVVLKVCDALAYAHAKGVVHRDVKPANVMVGQFGEAYLMDWGLARILGRTDLKDVRVRSAEAPSTRVLSDRRAATDPDSPLYTMDGDVLGTPAYMSPEQAMGRLDEVGPAADVYAVGAILYHLLSGCVPYVPRGGRLNNYAIWARAQEGPPRPLAELAPDAPPELLAICDGAMARDVRDRYPSVRALAEDLRAFREGAVVRAYESGAWAELRKWVARNKALASLAAGLVLALLVSSLWWSEARAQRRALGLERSQQELMADALVVAQIRREWEERKEPAPSRAPEARALLESARALVDRGDVHRANLERFGGASRARVAELSETELLRGWRIESTRQILDAIGELEDQVIPSIESYLTLCVDVVARSVDGPEARQRWRSCLESLAESAVYDLPGLTPQLGLLPIRQDSDSGLWEFLHVQTGAEPRIDTDGKYVVDGDTGIVLVLLPGGSHEGTAVEPFFMSKYETSQSQWTRVMASNPSFFASHWQRPQAPELQPFGPREIDGNNLLNKAVIDFSMISDLERRFEVPPQGLAGSERILWMRSTHPVECITWSEAQTMASRSGLDLPTSTQYAYACGDASSRHAHIEVPNDFVQMTDWGSPNSLGLYNMIGNVWSWCHERNLAENKASIRGGSWLDWRLLAEKKRLIDPEIRRASIGVRFVREIQN